LVKDGKDVLIFLSHVMISKREREDEEKAKALD